VVRFAVAGLGVMGARHCRVIRALPSAVLVGVCDAYAAQATSVARELQTRAFSNFDEMLASPDVDAVVLCVPSGLHAELGIRVARAGKHVVVEKPLACDESAARALVAECESHGVICAPICQYRYSDGFRALKWAVESGALDRPVLVRASVKWFRHDEYYTGSHWRGRRAGEKGGVLINQSVHAFDLLHWLFGEPVDVAGFCHGSRPHVMEMEDSAVAILRWRSGLLGTIEASTSAAPGFDQSFEINSPAATIRVEKQQVVYWWHKNGLRLPEGIRAPGEYEGVPDLDDRLLLFKMQYQNIIAAMATGAPLDALPGDAVAVVRTLDRVYASAGYLGRERCE